MKNLPVQFENQQIRRVYDEQAQTWVFSVVDIIQVLTQQPDHQGSRKYWKVLKGRLAKEGSEVVTNCYQLKLPADDGKMRLTDVANPQTLLRLVQSVPSPKAEPIKLWLAKVGYERMQEMADPALSLERVREMWQKRGRSDKWIQQRMTGPAGTSPKKPGSNWKKRPAKASSPARTFSRRPGTKNWTGRNGEHTRAMG
jgi:DNA-damage-inducible protein D